VDRQAVSGNDRLVNTFVSLRNTLLAHRDANTILGGGLVHQDDLSWSDVDTLIDRALSIVNRYSSLFRASTWQLEPTGSLWMLPPQPDPSKHLLPRIMPSWRVSMLREQEVVPECLQ
jgi:hypothetical protein